MQNLNQRMRFVYLCTYRIICNQRRLRWACAHHVKFTCVLGAQYDHLIETVLLSTNSIFLLRNKTNNYGLNIIKASGLVVFNISLCGNGDPQTALRIVINLPSEFVLWPIMLLPVWSATYTEILHCWNIYGAAIQCEDQTADAQSGMRSCSRATK